jgi:hypothetical protein
MTPTLLRAKMVRKKRTKIKKTKTLMQRKEPKKIIKFLRDLF